MSYSEDFTFLSPIPYPVNELPQDGIEIGLLTPEECVELFWRLKRVTVEASLSIFAKVLEEEAQPFWNDEKNIFLDSLLFDCASSKSMRERALNLATSPVAYANNEYSFLYIKGPYVPVQYPFNASFAQKNYVYSFGFQLGVGCVEISTDYIPRNSSSGIDSLHTVQRFPFKIFDKTYYLNLNVPYSIEHPFEHGLEARYSGSATVNFEFM